MGSLACSLPSTTGPDTPTGALELGPSPLLLLLLAGAGSAATAGLLLVVLLLVGGGVGGLVGASPCRQAGL
jgi:hypothetical protein